MRFSQKRAILLVTVLLSALFFVMLVCVDSPAAAFPNELEAIAFEASMRNRAQKVSLVCQVMRTKMTRTNYANLFFLKERGLLWCPVFKAASTSWIENFVNLSPLTKGQRILLRRRYPNPVDQVKQLITPITDAQDYSRAKSASPEVKSFLIVRHPFHRLVSAFRDKLERSHTKNYLADYYYRLIGQDIVRRYRTRALAIFGESIFSKERHYGALIPLPEDERVPEQPIFWEFIQYVLDTPMNQHNEHWVPIYTFCSVCNVAYDAIVQFESLSREEPLLEHFLSLSDVLPGGGLRLQNANANKAGLSHDAITQIYFDTLSDADVKRLFQLYAVDFSMFGYQFTFRNRTLPANHY